MPESQAQVRLAHAILSGKARKSGMPHGVAAEIVNKMHGRSLKSLPKKKKKSTMRDLLARKPYGK